MQVPSRKTYHPCCSRGSAVVLTCEIARSALQLRITVCSSSSGMHSPAMSPLSFRLQLSWLLHPRGALSSSFEVSALDGAFRSRGIRARAPNLRRFPSRGGRRDLLPFSTPLGFAVTRKGRAREGSFTRRTVSRTLKASPSPTMCKPVRTTGSTRSLASRTAAATSTRRPSRNILNRLATGSPAGGSKNLPVRP